MTRDDSDDMVKSVDDLREVLGVVSEKVRDVLLEENILRELVCERTTSWEAALRGWRKSADSFGGS